MTLRIAVLAALALFFFLTPAMADAIMFTPAGPGADFGVNDGAFYVSSSGIALPDESAFLSTSNFVLSPDGAGHLDAQAILRFTGGLFLGILPSEIIVTGYPHPVAVNL